MRKDFEKDVDDLKDTLQEYLRLQLDLEKLSLLEKLSQFGAYFFKIIVISYFSVIIVGFLLGGLAVWFGKTFDNYFAGVLIAALALLIVAVILIMLRKKIAVSSILHNFSQIFLNE